MSGRRCRRRQLQIPDITAVPPLGDDLVFESVTFSRQSRGVLRCGINNVRFSDIKIVRYCYPTLSPFSSLSPSRSLCSSPSPSPSSVFTANNIEKVPGQLSCYAWKPFEGFQYLKHNFNTLIKVDQIKLMTSQHSSTI